jgi:hypothetical protein
MKWKNFVQNHLPKKLVENLQKYSKNFFDAKDKVLLILWAIFRSSQKHNLLHASKSVNSLAGLNFFHRLNPSSLILHTVRKIYMARDGKYSHCAGKFTDTMHVKDQIEYFDF